MAVIKINIPNVCELRGAGGDSKIRGSQGEKGWRRARCRFPLVCSITIYKADIFPNKSFFSNLLHRTTDKLDVDSSCRGGRTDTLSEPVFCCAVVRIFIWPSIYLWTIVCVRRCADSQNDLRPFFDYTASLRIHNRRYMQSTFVHTMESHYFKFMDGEISVVNLRLRYIDILVLFKT